MPGSGSTVSIIDDANMANCAAEVWVSCVIRAYQAFVNE